MRASLFALYRTARITVPTVVDALRGRLTVERADARLSWWAERMMADAGIALDVRGADEVDWSRAYVIMSNHQSHYDIPVLYRVVPGTMRMVTKTELFRIPLFGRAMRAAGFVEVDRSNRAQAIASLRHAALALARGTHIWIAPEGTRSRTRELGRFKKGGFVLARDTGAAILPIAIDGTYDVLPPDTLSARRGRTVRVTFGRPIPAADREVPELMAEVEGFLRRHLG